MPTYASRRSSSKPPSSSARECGKTPSSIPAMKTIGYSRPLALCRVMSVTRPVSSERVLRGGPEARHGRGVGRRLPDADAHRLREAHDALQRRLPDPAPRRVDDALKRDDVLRVAEDREVRDRVLDLRALEELRAAD